MYKENFMSSPTTLWLIPHPNLPPSLTSHAVSVDVNITREWTTSVLRSCVKVEVAVLDSPSLIVLVVSVDVKQQ